MAGACVEVVDNVDVIVVAEIAAFVDEATVVDATSVVDTPSNVETGSSVADRKCICIVPAMIDRCKVHAKSGQAVSLQTNETASPDDNESRLTTEEIDNIQENEDLVSKV